MGIDTDGYCFPFFVWIVSMNVQHSIFFWRYYPRIDRRSSDMFYQQANGRAWISCLQAILCTRIYYRRCLESRVTVVSNCDLVFFFSQNAQHTANVATTVTSAGGATGPVPDDEEPAVAPPPRAASDRRPRRGAVSAEVYDENDATNYVKKVDVFSCSAESLFGQSHSPETRSRIDVYNSLSFFWSITCIENNLVDESLG